MPYIPGVEASGIITAVGESVFGKKIGDEVYGSVDGSYAAYAIAQGEGYLQATRFPLKKRLPWQAPERPGRKGDKPASQRDNASLSMQAQAEWGISPYKWLITQARICNCHGQRGESRFRYLAVNEVIDYKAAPETQAWCRWILYLIQLAETIPKDRWQCLTLKAYYCVLCKCLMRRSGRAAGVRALWRTKHCFHKEVHQFAG